MALTRQQIELESHLSPPWGKSCSLDRKKWVVKFFVDVYIMGGCLCIFVYTWMRHHPLGADQSSRFRGSNFVWILGYNTSLWRV